LVSGGKFLNYRGRGIIIMTKAELIVAMAKDASITKIASAEVLSSLMETVTRELKKNGKFGLVGFGSFSVTKRKARKGRNPQTGEEIKIKAKKVIKFKPGKALAEKINR
jgi:Bacterial nucleoid DNA-binding protein